MAENKVKGVLRFCAKQTISYAFTYALVYGVYLMLGATEKGPNQATDGHGADRGLGRKSTLDPLYILPSGLELQIVVGGANLVIGTDWCRLLET